VRSSRSILLFVLITFAKSATAQQVAAAAPQPTALLQESLTALSGGHPLTDVTLTGTVRRIAGSDDESGTAVLKALASGASRTDLTLPSGERSEVINCLNVLPSGAWSGSDGVSHAIVYHNLLTAPSWFFPGFTIAQSLSSSHYVASYIGHETRNGEAVEHVSISQPIDSSHDPTGLLRHLSQMEIYLDSGTLLPSAISYNVHPDDNGLLDIPVEVQFNDYRAVGGSQIPYHVQKLMNNLPVLDIQAQSVAVNTSLNATAFSVQ
jgi:hypothetical protein